MQDFKVALGIKQPKQTFTLFLQLLHVGVASPNYSLVEHSTQHSLYSELLVPDMLGSSLDADSKF
jgi:hypothetical protein